MPSKNINSPAKEETYSKDIDKIHHRDKKAEEVDSEEEKEVNPSSSYPSYSNVLEIKLRSSPPLIRSKKDRSKKPPKSNTSCDPSGVNSN